MNSEAIIFTVILRVIATIYCYNKAEKLNRNTGGWSFFGFVSPLVAVIWIQFMNPIILPETNEEVSGELSQQ